MVGTEPDYLGRSRRLLGLLVDRGFGLAAWQPAWLLAVPAAGRPGQAPPAPAGPPWPLPLAAGWLVATFVALTMHGWWFAGRQVVVVLPLAALAVAWWAGPDRRRRLLLAVAGWGGVLAFGCGWSPRAPPGGSPGRSTSPPPPTRCTGPGGWPCPTTWP